MVHPLGLFTSCPSWFPALLVFQQKPRKRITSITSSPVAWPLLNLLPPLCTCQIYPIKVLDGCSCYHTFSLFLFMRKFNKEKKPQTNETKQKTQRRKLLPFLLPVVPLASPTLQVPDCSTARAGAAKKEMQGKKDAIMIWFSETALVP